MTRTAAPFPALLTLLHTVLLPALLTALLAACASPSAAPPASPTASPTPGAAGPTAALGFMVGRWSGSGWAAGRDGRRGFVQTEDVAPRLDGQLLTVDGDGHDAADPGRAVHAAFAVVDRDPASGGYRWVAYSQGSRIETALRVEGTAFRWSFAPTPGIVVRYTATFRPGDGADPRPEWHETGETSRDGGATWTPSLDMRLRRVA